jgi:hypothetical protein
MVIDHGLMTIAIINDRHRLLTTVDRRRRPRVLKNEMNIIGDITVVDLNDIPLDLHLQVAIDLPHQVTDLEVLLPPVEKIGASFPSVSSITE